MVIDEEGSIRTSSPFENEDTLGQDLEAIVEETAKRLESRNITPKEPTTRESIWSRLFKRYFAIKALGILLALYTTVLSFTTRGTFGSFGGLVDPETGYIIDLQNPTNTENGVILSNGIERSVVAGSRWELLCLVVAKLTAFYMYPGS